MSDVVAAQGSSTASPSIAGAPTLSATSQAASSFARLALEAARRAADAISDGTVVPAVRRISSTLQGSEGVEAFGIDPSALARAGIEFVDSTGKKLSDQYVPTELRFGDFYLAKGTAAATLLQGQEIAHASARRILKRLKAADDWETFDHKPGYDLSRRLEKMTTAERRETLDILLMRRYGAPRFDEENPLLVVLAGDSINYRRGYNHQRRADLQRIQLGGEQRQSPRAIAWALGSSLTYDTFRYNPLNMRRTQKNIAAGYADFFSSVHAMLADDGRLLQATLDLYDNDLTGSTWLSRWPYETLDPVTGRRFIRDSAAGAPFREGTVAPLDAAGISGFAWRGLVQHAEDLKVAGLSPKAAYQKAAEDLLDLMNFGIGEVRRGGDHIQRGSQAQKRVSHLLADSMIEAAENGLILGEPNAKLAGYLQHSAVVHKLK